MELTYSIKKQCIYIYIYIGKVIDFYKPRLHGEHECNNHAKYDSFQMIFPQLLKEYFLVVSSCFSWNIEVTKAFH